MKVRISGNTIRFRLKQSEVKQFQQTGEVKEITSFGLDEINKLSFILKEGCSAVFTLAFQSNSVTLEVPRPLCSEWTETKLVGFEEIIDTGKQQFIKILVEKDFKCLDGSDMDNEDTFPNPNHPC